MNPTHPDLAYGKHPRQTVDLWIPDGEGNFPLMLFFHGGGFVEGDKQENLNPRFRDKLLAAGIAVASANYRYSTQAPYPAPMEDGARALQFLRANAGKLGLDGQRVCLGGSSAGGTIAAWIGYSPDRAVPNSADTVSQQSTRPRCLYLEMTPITMDPRRLREIFPGERPPDPVLTAFFGVHPDKWNEMPGILVSASPLDAIDASAPPTFACCYQPETPITPDMERTERYHHPVFQRLLIDACQQHGVPYEAHFLEESPAPYDPNSVLALWEDQGIAWMRRWFDYCTTQESGC